MKIGIAAAVTAILMLTGCTSDDAVDFIDTVLVPSMEPAPAPPPSHHHPYDYSKPVKPATASGKHHHP